jgi:V-type H+-transporting ATPase subunit a
LVDISEDNIRQSSDELEPQRPQTAGLSRATTSSAPQLAGMNRIEWVAGTIATAKYPVFERILWRVMRGNVFLSTSDIEERIVDPDSQEEMEKSVFLVFAQAGPEIMGKIRKISESMGATLYPVEEDRAKRRDDATQVHSRIEDLSNVLHNTQQTRRAELITVADSLRTWEDIVKKEKSIYHALNMCHYDKDRKTILAEGWIPTSSVPEARQVLKIAGERTGATVPPVLNLLESSIRPPTFFRTNRFTAGFQNIVDAYGVAKYEEVNPGLFTITTFPFLFGMMFGDIGHGLLLTIVGLLLCLNERKLARYRSDEMFGMVFGGRYMILLMGLWSTYIGFVYNDMFSRSLDLFGSGWAFSPREKEPFDPIKQHGMQTGYQTKGMSVMSLS